jgi:hypothetical protein
MTAFDGNGTKVSVYFDSGARDIQISLSDDPEDQSDGTDSITVYPSDIAQIILDLTTAYYIRTGHSVLPEVLARSKVSGSI